MKVRPSVKKMCEKCKVIRRHGAVRVICDEPAPQAAAGLGSNDGSYRRRRHPPREAARDLAHLHLRHRPHDRAADLRRASASTPDTRVRDLTDEEVAQLRTYIDANLKVEGDLRREIAAGHQAQDGDRLLPGPPPPPGLPVHGQRTHTNARTRKGPKKTVAGKKKVRK